MFDIDTEISLEGDRHDCCCEHVVEHFDASLACGDERHHVVRAKYFACPHHDVTPLEIYLDQLSRGVTSGA